MKRLIIIGLLLMILFPIIINPTEAISAGYERQQCDIAEVYFEYMPIVPYDPSYPTANEEFAFTFYIVQHSFWANYINKYKPAGWQITILVNDLTENHEASYCTMKRWYPISYMQLGATVEWGLSYSPPSTPLSISGRIDFSPLASITVNYDRERFGDWLRLSWLNVNYDNNYPNWFQDHSFANGAGSIGIANDIAQSHEHHAMQIHMHVALFWDVIFGIGVGYTTFADFVLGDDDPENTDCSITVEQARTDFTEQPRQRIKRTPRTIAHCCFR